MTWDRALAERVRRTLSNRSDIVEKRMVGGISFSVNDSMCCGVTGDALMVRVGRDARDAALAEPHVRPMLLGGKVLAGFVLVDPEGLEDGAALQGWLERGLQFASGLGGRRAERG